MFASWSAGEYGSVGATEWLEVSTTLLYPHVQKRKESAVTRLFVFRVICPQLTNVSSPT